MPREYYQISQSPDLQSVITELNNILAEMSIRMNFIANDGDNVSLTNTKITNLTVGTEDTDALNLSQVVEREEEDLIASRIVQTDANNQLASILNLSLWVLGTSNQVTVTNTTGGKVTLSLPQNIHTGASPTFVGLTLSGLTALQVLGANASKGVISTGVTTANLVSLTNDSMVDGLHRHSELSASDGDPSPALSADVDGNVTAVANLIIPVTASADVGVIKQAGVNLIHTYGTRNFFAAENSGNFTLTGQRNVGIGEKACVSLTSGVGNFGLGFDTVSKISIGSGNIGIGTQAIGSGIGTNQRNTAIGEKAFYGIVDGNQAACNDNLALGNGAFQHAYFLRKNIAIGTNAGRGSASTMAGGAVGDESIYIGYNSALNIGGAGSTNYNTFIGAQTGLSLTGGDGNILIGRLADVSGGTSVNEIVIGNNLTGLGSNTVVIGNDSITKTVLKGDVGIGTESPDAKLEVSTDIHIGTNSTVDGVRNQKYTCGAYTKVQTTVQIQTKDEWHPALEQVADNCRDFTFTQGEVGVITGIVQNGSDITVTFAGVHTILEGAPIAFVGGTGYDGLYIVNAVGADTVDVTAAYVADGTGVAIAGDYFTVPVDGLYFIAAWMSGQGLTGFSTVEFDIGINDASLDKGRPSRKFANTIDRGNMASSYREDLTAGDKITFLVRNITNTNNFDVYGARADLHRIV